MVPHTRDGRVMFAIPWHGHTLVGTTDTPIPEPTLEPLPLDRRSSFILETARLYLTKLRAAADVLSVFAGIRPLVRSGDGRIPPHFHATTPFTSIRPACSRWRAANGRPIGTWRRTPSIKR